MSVSPYESQLQLKIFTFGGLRIERGGEPIDEISSRKALALLVYLVLTGKPISRETLADLLWDDRPQAQAQSNLRTLLSVLKKQFMPFLEISRYTVGLNPEMNIWMDARQLDQALSEPGTLRATLSTANVSQIESVLELYHGDFLEGFNLNKARGFEHWMVVETERFRTQVLNALRIVVNYYLEETDYEHGVEIARRLLEINPQHESVHRELMRMLAYTGQREQAIRQFLICQRILNKELGVEPQKETIELHDLIRNDQLNPPENDLLDLSITPFSPKFLDKDLAFKNTIATTFVGRAHELDRLNTHLDQAQRKQGQLAFIIGEAGSGKTSLLNEFVHQAQARLPDLIIARGICSAYIGIGDPYLPFRDILSAITGDVEDAWNSGLLSTDQAQRIWAFLPMATDALIQYGPDLFGGVIDGRALASRLAAHPDEVALFSRLTRVINNYETRPRGPAPQQTRLFRHYTEFLKALSKIRPLLLILDDLHWIDTSSAALLFHMSREIEINPIFILGAYRPEEVNREMVGEAHPLASMLAEFKRQYGNIWVDLDQMGPDKGRKFIDALVDVEPNRLGDEFRQKLTNVTHGHALFTVEQLSDLRARNELLKDKDGMWIEGKSIQWESIPAKVDGVVAKRIGLLDNEMQKALKIGSVEGETFTAEVVAHVLEIDARDLISQLHDEVAGRHHLVREQSFSQISGSQITHFIFHHNLYQHHLYQGLSQGERSYLHREVGEALENIYKDESELVSVQLARHFEEANQNDKAIHYLHLAAQRALGISANNEAVGHLSKALNLLNTLPDEPDRISKELELLVLRAIGLMNTKGYGDSEVGEAFNRAHDICTQLGAVPQLAPVLYGLFSYYLSRPDYETSMNFGEQILSLAPESEYPKILRVLGHNAMIANLTMTGRFKPALVHGEKLIANYAPDQHTLLVQLAGDNLSITNGSWRALATYLIGDSEGAQTIRRQTIAHAQELGHPNSLAFGLTYSVYLDYFDRNPDAVMMTTDELGSLAKEHDLVLHNAFALIFKGWALAASEHDASMVDLIDQGLAILDAIGINIFRPYLLTVMGDAWALVGDPRRGLELVDNAIRLGGERNERFFEAETYRIKGELLEKLGDNEDKVAEYYNKAIKIAGKQSAKFLEQKARKSLAQLQNKSR